jgi:hypothetical protein
VTLLLQYRPEMSESEALSSAILDEMDVLEAFAPDTPPQVGIFGGAHFRIAAT